MSKITKKGNHIFVPDHVTIPYIEGDGVGHEITPISQKIVNAAIKQAYNGTRSIEWKEVLAGEKAFKQTGSWLPDETMEAFREYIVGIKGPLTTPIGGGIRSLNLCRNRMATRDSGGTKVIEVPHRGNGSEENTFPGNFLFRHQAGFCERYGASGACRYRIRNIASVTERDFGTQR